MKRRQLNMTYSSDNTDLISFSLLQVFIGQSEGVSKLAFTPTGRELISCGEAVFIWQFLGDSSGSSSNNSSTDDEVLEQRWAERSESFNKAINYRYFTGTCIKWFAFIGRDMMHKESFSGHHFVFPEQKWISLTLKLHFVYGCLMLSFSSFSGGLFIWLCLFSVSQFH